MTDRQDAATMDASRSLLGRPVGVAFWVLLVSFLYVAWPAGFGGSTGYTIVSGRSMEPTYVTGDLVIGRAKAGYRIGDVITYEVPKGQPGEGHRVVHRIVGGDDTHGWVTQGDNNETTDFWRPRNADVISATVVRIPKLGYVLHWATSPLAYALIGALVIGGLFWPGSEEEEEGAAPRPAPVPVPAPAPAPAAISAASGVTVPA